MSKSKSQKKVAPATDAAATEPVVVTTATKKAAAKVAKPTKPAPTPKPEKQPKEELCVFAIRLTLPERDAIHAAAGPGKASRFIRALAVAAANRDEALVATILKGVNQTEA